MKRARLVLGLLLGGTGATLALAPTASAGGGPETTVVVVNADSPTSWRLANEYVRARRIPRTHVVAIDGVPTLTTIDVDTFRTRLWAPLEATLKARGILDTTDLIAWSADFPYGVRFDADKATKDLRNPPITPTASLTSMTYLARRVKARDADGYLGMQVNRYYRRYPDEGRGGLREMTADEAGLQNEAMSHLVEKGWAKAIEAYEKLLASWKDDPAAYYNYACSLARVGRAEDAMKALASAVATGFSDAAHTREDADLETLRSREDFTALLTRMEKATTGAVQPSHGFHSTDLWTGADGPVPDASEDAKDRYWLSTLLAYTGEWGNSMPEVTSALAASVASDGTDPKGTFYFLANSDVRATTRMPRFEAAVEALRAMGKKAVILSKDVEGQTGVLPVDKDDVLGGCLGVAGFTWKDSKSRILPGAICEHLTSFGAVFDHGGQTKLTELIRSGVAGASGTVYEPYALREKFPSPHLQVHYAAGCSLAEAFYQSVYGPYQLLVVGDGLARPFARFANVELSLPTRVSGTVKLAPTITPAPGHPLGRVELFVDGVRVGAGEPGAALNWDTTTAEDGAHEVRVIAIESGPIGTRSDAVATTWVAQEKREATLTAPTSVAYEGTLVLSGKAPDCTDIEVFAGARVIATAKVAGDEWKASVPASRLGLGVTVLQARGTSAKGRGLRSAFREVVVSPPPMRKAGKAPGSGATDGFACEVTRKGSKPATFVVAGLGGSGQEPVAKTIEAKAKGPYGAITLTGQVEASVTGLYEVIANAGGALDVEIDGKPCIDAPNAALDRQVYGLVSLEAGWHAWKIRYVPTGSPDLTILLGGDVVTHPLVGKAVRHTGK